MAKKESGLLSMVMTLFIITLVASTALGFIYEITKGPISEAIALRKATAISEVVPDFDNSPASDLLKVEVDGDTLYFYKAMKDGQFVGVAVETFTDKGFSGKFRIMVGFLPDGTINEITVIEHKETPGLGDKMEKDKSFNKSTGLSWTSQFLGKHPDEFSLAIKKDGGDVDAITAATISSRAFCDAVQRAYTGFVSIKAELIQE
jgi:electron transport complex protein RnfG